MVKLVRNSIRSTELSIAYSPCYSIVLMCYNMRVSEILNITFKDIDRENGLIHIMEAKFNKQRPVPLSKDLQEKIIEYYRLYKPIKYLFEGQNVGEKYTESSINQFLKKYALLAGIRKNVHIHLLRHEFTSHYVEKTKDIYGAQKILGHASPITTAKIYTHINPNIVANSYNLLNDINI